MIKNVPRHFYVYIYIKLIKIVVCFLRRPSISPEYKKAEVSELLTLPKQPQTQTVDNPAEKEKKSPVICRVLEDPQRTTYKM